MGRRQLATDTSGLENSVRITQDLKRYIQGAEMAMNRMFSLVFLLVGSFSQRVKIPDLPTCEGRPPIQPGDKICGGAVIGELGDQIMVCVAGGDLEFKSKKILEAGECEWYGKFYCNVEVVEDLSKWWFHVTCEKGSLKLRPPGVAALLGGRRSGSESKRPRRSVSLAGSQRFSHFTR